MKLGPAASMLKKWTALAVILLLLPLLVSASPAPSELPFLTLTERQLCDLEMIMDGSFSPLKSFMSRKDYDSVVADMRLADGTLWPIPIILDISESQLDKIKEGTQVALKDSEGFILATFDVNEIWQPEKKREAELVYGTDDPSHPGVNYLYNRTGSHYLSGELTEIQIPLHFDFTDLRRNPEELKRDFKESGIEKSVAFHLRTPMHKIHYELAMAAAAESDAHLLIQPTVGVTKGDDIDPFTRGKCYRKALAHFPKEKATLSFLPLAMRMAGPREALWHAIIDKNYGCTHFALGCDHGGAGTDQEGVPFYDDKAAQELLAKHSAEIGISVICLKKMVFVDEDGRYEFIDQVEKGKSFSSPSWSEIKRELKEGGEIPQWFTFPEVAEELKKVYPPRSEEGFTLFFTGLSGSGKSTLAKGVAAKLMEVQDRPVTMLDGDVIRNHLSAGLGFSKEHRSINVRRVGFVASEITKNRGVAICPMIAPYAEDRSYNREVISANGNFIEIYVSTSFDACADRDTKGLYKLAMEGKLKGFTGLDDPYEIPVDAEIVIDTTRYTIAEGVELIINYLRKVKHIN